jgi:tetratricopeptide (TPR) repeat protein
MAVQDIRELLASGDEALAEAGFRTGDFGQAREILESAHAAATEAADLNARASALERLGMLAHYENITKLMAGAEVKVADIEAEEKLFRQALACWQEAGEAAGTAQSLFGLGLVFQVLHSDWMTAMPYFWQALGLVNAPGQDDLYLRSEVHRHVGFYYLVEDVQPDEAVRHLQISLDLREELGDERRIPSGLVALADAQLAAGSPQQAVELLQRAVTQARGAGLLQQRIEDAEKSLHDAEAAAAGAKPPPTPPEGTAPETTAPETTAPESSAEQDDVSGSTPSEGGAPESPASDGPAPDSSEPDGPAPETPEASPGS